MKETMKKLRKCLDCDLDISDLHFNRKRCHQHAKVEAINGVRKSIRKWKSNNKSKVKLMNKEWSEKFPLKKRLSHARDIARRRQHICDITDEQFISYWNTSCIYCQKSIINETGIGLDRLDNNKHYTLDNVVPCCGACNQIRNNHLTHDEMKTAMQAVIKFRKIKLGET